MSRHSFTQWLCRETLSAKGALLMLYERRDQMKYQEGPRLERSYMEQIGPYEEPVIRAEIECEILKKKQQMIQTAINRRKPVDEAAMDAELEQMRQQMFREAEGDAAPQEYAVLSDEQNEQLRELYHKIVAEFHPQMHPELTQAHRELFQKAQDAYRRRDLSALQLIYDMLKSAQGDGLGLLLTVSIGAGDENAEASAEEFDTDYSLAAELYDSFAPTGEDAVFHGECARCRELTEEVTREMDLIRSAFPFTAAEMLADPEKIRAYKEELAYRLRTAQQERERREREIKDMIESVGQS